VPEEVISRLSRVAQFPSPLSRTPCPRHTGGGAILRQASAAFHAAPNLAIGTNSMLYRFSTRFGEGLGFSLVPSITDQALSIDAGHVSVAAAGG